MMMFALQPSCPSEEGGSEAGGGGRGGRSKKGRLDRNSDARPGRFQMTYSIRNVRCEEQEKTWTVESGALIHRRGRGG